MESSRECFRRTLLPSTRGVAASVGLAEDPLCRLCFLAFRLAVSVVP